MKKIISLFKLTIFAAVLLLINCGNYFDPAYTIVLPSLPEPWTDLLGEPHWRLQWIDSAGQLQKKDILYGESLEVDIPVTWTNPVTAWPWWSSVEFNIPPGLFKPAGGLFPFDAQNGKINLTWEAGPDTVYYWELIYANSSNKTRIPANFDWQRFRGLFTPDVLGEDICKDPWLIDWQSVAERTIASGFDRRRLIPEETTDMDIPAGTGPWYGASPFAEPLVFEEEETPLFPVRRGINVWISAEGILRVSGNTWILTELRK